MKQPSLLAMLSLLLSPFALCAQEDINRSSSFPVQTSKEKISAAVMKTTPIRPVIVLQYAGGHAPMNLTNKEELKMPTGKGTATAASPQRRMARKATPNAMNLSPKEKMRMGL